MNKERVFPVSVKKLGKLDEIVLELGQNNDDGWGHNKEEERASLPKLHSPLLYKV